MCLDRRETIGLIDMSGTKPKRILGINMTETMVKLTFVTVVLGIFGTIYACGTIAYNWMETEGDRAYHFRLEESLSPPDGEIHQSIEDAIEISELVQDAKMHEQFKEINDRTIRLETLMETVYEVTVGKAPPQ